MSIYPIGKRPKLHSQSTTITSSDVTSPLEGEDEEEDEDEVTAEDTISPVANRDEGPGSEVEDVEAPEEDEEGEEQDEEEEDEEDMGEDQPSVVEFSVGDLVWGAARGHPYLPGKVVPPPNGGGGGGESSRGGGQKRSTWVRWFGGRPVIELVPMESLKSFSEGLDAHHSAQKETRK